MPGAIRKTLVAAALGGLAAAACLACPYNVRESGFVDLGLERYFLFCYTDAHTPPGLLATVKKKAGETLRDSRVVFETVRVDVQDNNPALQYLEQPETTPLPALVLVSPAESTMAIPLAGPAPLSAEAFDAAFRRVATSPFRQSLIRDLARNYGVVLLIEGAAAGANRQARKAAEAAIEAINQEMQFMPKPIERGPVILTLEREAFPREKILLWSLGLDGEQLQETGAAVLYGRARRIGPVLRGEQITKKSLYNILSVVGADCECGIDPRWIRGTGIPVRWDRRTQAAVAAGLGFDPENPMVITEVIQIMRMRTSFYPWAFSSRRPADPPVDELPVPFVEDTQPAGSRRPAGGPVLSMLLYTLAGMAALAIVAAVFLMVRAARRKS